MKNNKFNDSIDFSSIMAVAVHDMKNSLSLLLQSIEHLNHSLPETLSESREHLVDVHYEANRMNTTLVQILSLFRADIDALPTNIDECFVSDLMHEIVQSNVAYTKQRRVDVDIKIDGDLSWYLDRDLIFLLMHDVFVNAIRYEATVIKIRANIVEGMLELFIEDNGPGYPQTMLDMSYEHLDRLCLSEGRTGLGLFFAKLIAQTHKNGGKIGKITLSNSQTTGGSIFKVLLP